MKLLLVVSTVLHLVLGASIVDVTCPDSCTCQGKEDYLETSCTSYEFIKKLIPKQISTIVRLNINNASLVNIDSKLKYLKNLNYLDLSNNSISTLPSQFPYLPKLKNLNLSNNLLTNVTFSQLPKNLQIIDLSNNSIEDFPKDWTSLKQLKTLHIHDNPIYCDYNNLLIYEQLLSGGINISKNLTCHNPKEFHGRLFNSINSSMVGENLLNSMLGDEGGSGDSENFDDPALPEEQEFFKADTHDQTELNKEGSGDDEEGSGQFIEIPSIIQPKACYFNCSTPNPVGQNDEKNASPVPPLQKQLQIFAEDIFQPGEVTEPPPTSQETIKEEEFVKETDNHDVELVPTNDTVIGEMERASINSSNSRSVYIIVGLLVAFVTFLIIYFANKKRNQKKRNSQRKRNKSNENGVGEELKPLGKSAEVAKSLEQINSKPEAAPLLNGQNGKVNEENNIKDDDELEEVEIRKSDKQELLTPQPERVTIKAAELPDSIPKTPLLVHRQLNSDGEIITTAINSN